MKNYTEKDLCPPIIDFFAPFGYDARSEVLGCDIALKCGDELIIVELKKSFNMTLLFQAIDRQKISDMVYVAIPRPKKEGDKHRKTIQILDRLGLGLLLVAMDSPLRWVEAVLLPEPMHKANPSARAAVLKEMNSRVFDGNVGGSSRAKLMTAYREKSIRLACALELLGVCKAAQMKNHFGCAENSWQILSRNIYGWFERAGDDGFKLTQAGRDALDGDKYSRFVEYYRKAVKECMT